MRYRVRHACDDHEDREFLIETTAPTLAAACFADEISDEDGHQPRLVEVMVDGVWKRFKATPYTVTRYATEEVA